MAIYLGFESIKGNVTAAGFEQCVEINTMEFGVKRPIRMEVGKMANREVGKPSLSTVTLTKTADNSVAALFKEAVSGSSGKKATLNVVRTGSDKVETFLEYTLYDCLINSYRIMAIGDEEPQENISLSFSQCEITYKDHNATNKTGSPQRTGYDLAKAIPL
ncbi:MAG: type VI secretion system tube protein Hcp [Ectothiorhodospiraceae bacterium]|nr:type VI secretion system tube protein Hcp [Ectothiorhodospiraceae bacterium]